MALFEIGRADELVGFWPWKRRSDPSYAIIIFSFIIINKT
jgi:hypothetical protein